MKNKLQKLLGAIALAYRFLKNNILFGNITKYLVGGKFKKPTNNPDLIDINTIDIGNLKTTMFCDLKIDSNKLNDIVGDRIDKIIIPKTYKTYKSLKYFELVYGNPQDEFDEICNYLESLFDDEYFEKYLKMDYMVRLDYLSLSYLPYRATRQYLLIILDSKN